MIAHRSSSINVNTNQVTHDLCYLQITDFLPHPQTLAVTIAQFSFLAHRTLSFQNLPYLLH